MIIVVIITVLVTIVIIVSLIQLSPSSPPPPPVRSLIYTLYFHIYILYAFMKAKVSTVILTYNASGFFALGDVDLKMYTLIVYL